MNVNDGNGGANYTITYVGDNFAITARPITLTGRCRPDKIYGAADPAFTASVTSGALQFTDSLTGAQTRVAGEDVGNFAISQGTLNVNDGNGGGNYTITYVGDNFAITARPITLTADAGQTKIYGAADPAFTASVTSGALQFTDSLTGAQTRVAGEDVGNFAISQGTLNVNDGNGGGNYTITYVGDNFAITARPITLTADASQTKIYGAADPAFTASVTSGALQFTDSLTGAQTRVAGEDVGNFAISQGALTVNDGNGGGNYSITYVGDNFAITALGITLTADAGQTKIYGAADPTFTQTITSGSLQGGDTLTGASTRVAGEDVGNFAISQGTLNVNDGNGGANYTITYVGDNFAITARPITLTADAGQTKIYGAADLRSPRV